MTIQVFDETVKNNGHSQGSIRSEQDIMTGEVYEKNFDRVVSEPASSLEERGGSIEDISEKEPARTRRGLTPRHLSLVVVGGSIGTGLFIGLGTPLVTAGPLSLLLGFGIYSCLVMWPLMQIVGEMCTWLPIRGSLFHFASRYVDDAFGFAAGWQYLYGALMFCCIEFTATTSVIQYWDATTNPGAWIAICIGVSVFLNIFSVKFYGETEFISSSFKVLLIIGLMLLTFITMVGGNPRHDVYGFRNWKDGGVMHEYLEAGSLGRFLGFWSTLIYAAFACGGPDILMMVAGETIYPTVNIPKAAKKSYIRIYLFYIGGVFFLGTICSSKDARLLAAMDGEASGSALSPWVIGISNMGISGLADLVNVLMMTSAWSCGNAYVYSASRTMYALALNGMAPKIFTKCLKNGVPIYCVLFTGLISCISFLSVSNKTLTVFNWFVNLGTVSFLVTYITIFFVYLRFRKAMAVQVGLENLPFKTPFKLQPYITYFSMGFACVITFFNGFDIFWPGEFTASGFFTSYFGIFFSIGLYLFWKIFKRTKFVSPEEADLFSGKQEIEEEEEQFREKQASLPPPNKWAKRVTDFLF